MVVDCVKFNPAITPNCEAEDARGGSSYVTPYHARRYYFPQPDRTKNGEVGTIIAERKMIDLVRYGIVKPAILRYMEASQPLTRRASNRGPAGLPTRSDVGQL
jgi:hypothetical protein